MDQRPVARRTRARTAESLLQRLELSFNRKRRTGEPAGKSQYESVNDSDGLKRSGSRTMPIDLDGSDSEGDVVFRGEKDPDDMERKDFICVDDQVDELGVKSTRLSKSNVVENDVPDPVPTSRAVPRSSRGSDDNGGGEDARLQKCLRGIMFDLASGDENEVEPEKEDDDDYNVTASDKEGVEGDTDSSSEEAVLERSGGSDALKRGSVEEEIPVKFGFFSSSSSLSNGINEDDGLDFHVEAFEVADGAKDEEVVKHSSVDSAQEHEPDYVAGQTNLKPQPQHHHEAEGSELGTADNPSYKKRSSKRKHDDDETERRVSKRSSKRKHDDDYETEHTVSKRSSKRKHDDDETEHRVSKRSSKRKRDGGKQQMDFTFDDMKFGKYKKRKPAKMDTGEIILNSILDGEELPMDDALSAKDKVRVEDTSDSESDELYPKKFYPGDKPKPPPEEPIEEKALWDQMSFAMASSAVSSNGHCIDEEEAEIPSKDKKDPLTCCAQGKHKLFVDEEVGLVCQYCSYVEAEIRYLVPGFEKPPSKRKVLTTEDKLRGIDLSFRDQSFEPESKFANPEFANPPCKAEGTVWDLVPGVKNSMYPHQQEGFEFIWKNVAGGTDLAQLKEQSVSDSSGYGCIISHAPGTGKTRLAIVFVQSYLNMYPDCRPVIIAPANMLLTWEEEFKKWKTGIHFHNLNNSVLTGKEVLRWRNSSESVIREVKLHSWSRGGSVLGISYHLFKYIVGDKNRKTNSGWKNGRIRKILLEFPGLLVMDEGHIPRNADSDVFKALSEVRTEKRISMSGTPFQNNFDELFNILNFVRPKFTVGIRDQESSQDFVKKRGRKGKAEREKWTNLTSAIGKKVDDREADEQKLNQVRDLLAPFVHVHKGTVLQDRLPGLRQSVVFLRPFPRQIQLIEAVKGVDRDTVGRNHFISSVTAHPSLYLELGKTLRENLYGKLGHLTAELKSWRLNPEYGAKMKFTMDLLRLSEALNEKVLIFSEFLKPLKLIRDQVKFNYNWVEGRDVLYMDGKQDVQLRQTFINSFNDPSNEVKVMLASKSACAEGINLIGASRLVLLDVAWNPSRDSQAISRAYRLGQKKFVHVYRLVTLGTMEEDKCCRQAKKDWMSRSVFFSPDAESSNSRRTPLKSMEDKILEELQHHDKMKYIDKIVEYDEDSLGLGLGL